MGILTDSVLHTGPREITVRVDDRSWVFADGRQVVNTPNWRAVQSGSVPAHTKVLAIHGWNTVSLQLMSLHMYEIRKDETVSVS